MRFEEEIVTGTVVGLYNSIHDVSYGRPDAPDYLHTKEVESIQLDFGGIIGNRHYGVTRITDGRTRFMYEKGSVEIRNNAQWTAISEDEIIAINKNLELDENELKPEYIGMNILVTGIPNFTKIPRGHYLVFTETEKYVNQDPNQVVLIVHGEVNPCAIAGAGVDAGTGRTNIANQFPKAANRLRGLRGWVEKPGVIKTGMYIHILYPTGRT
ncbi:MAG: MOSC domain-containing protein [Candidatus Kariarchaeaceae archaeon]